VPLTVADPISADTEYIGGATRDIPRTPSTLTELSHCPAITSSGYRESADIGYAAEGAPRMLLYRSG